MALPGKKVTADSNKSKQSRESDKIKKNLKRIGSICQQCSENIGQIITDKDRLRLNDIILELNNIYSIEIEVL